MAKAKKVELPVAPLPDLERWLRKQKTRAAVIGGLAASLQGRPRYTRDVDILVILPEEEWAEFLAAASKFGFQTPNKNPLKYAHTDRVMLLRHMPSSIDIDVSLGTLGFEEEALARSTLIEISGINVPLATPEDLVIMKAIAGRPQDWFDIDGLLAANAKMDVRRIRKWVKEFAVHLDASDMVDELEKRLAGWSTPRRHKKK